MEKWVYGGNAQPTRAAETRKRIPKCVPYATLQDALGRRGRLELGYNADIGDMRVCDI